MVAPSLSVFHSSGEVIAPSWASPRKLSGTGYIAEFDLRHAVTDWLELTVAARRTQLADARWTEFTVRYYY